VCKERAELYAGNGMEGAMLKSPDHIYKVGKRVNDCIKLKPRHTVDLLCIGIEDGEGKYDGMIGSLLLKDSKGMVVSAGSGLVDEQRKLPKEYFIGKVVEIYYEQILDTYIQPIIKCIREDKESKDID